MTWKQFALLCFLSTVISSCACDPERMVRGMMWGFNKMVGEGYFPSDEILEFGDFERVEVNMNQQRIDGEDKSFIELRFYNGKNPALQYQQENIAFRCAELYARDYSKIKNYDQVIVFFIFSDPVNPENYAINEYSFEIAELLNNQNPVP